MSKWQPKVSCYTEGKEDMARGISTSYKVQPIVYRIKRRSKIILGFLYFYSLLWLKTPKTFTFNGQTYKYFWHWYNFTWRNERSIEIPIIREKVQSFHGKRILEVGNVLSHYTPCQHDILDKYEKGRNVMNQDVVDFQPSEKYDLIVSISTLEHVGWEEVPQEPRKILHALENLKNKCLAPGGQIVVTLPLGLIGLNPEMDKLLREGKLCFTKQYCMKRVSKSNEWIEIGWHEVRRTKYTPSPYCNTLVIGIENAEA